MASGVSLPGSHPVDPGPLKQRLLLYGFAWLQVDPFMSNAVEMLGIKGLQLLETGPDAHHWRSLFAGADAYSQHSAYAVISPSLSTRKLIRATQPQRPLIYVQTAYASPPGPRALSALFGGRPQLARRLHPSDPFRPLRLYRSVSFKQPPELHLSYQEFPRHPMADFKDHAERVDPYSQFWAQEDGLILQQRSLFHAGRRLPDFLARSLPYYDQLFLQQIRDIPQGAYFLATDRETLDWFRSDCVRLLSKHYSCWDFPEQGDPRDPCVPLILVHDALLEFAALDRDLPLIHLNGSERLFRFRALRKRNPQPPNWRPDKPGNRIAHHIYYGYRLTFSHHHEGWFCADGQTNGPDGEQQFSQYLDTLEELGV